MAGESRSKAPLVVAIIVAIGLVVAVRFVTSGGGDDGKSGSSDKPVAAGDCTALAVTASSEKAALLSGIADDYNRGDHRVDGRCVRVTVTSKASGGAAEALARGWTEPADGPRPDVWTPASSSWTVLLRQNLADQDKP